MAKSRKWFAALLGTVMTVAAGAVTFPGPAGAIYNGYTAPGGKYDFMVGLYGQIGSYTYRCSGTLIAPDLVLTAGHCDGSVTTAYIGQSGNPWTRPSALAVPLAGSRWGTNYNTVAEKNNDGTNRNDIAIFKLAYPVSNSVVKLGNSEPALNALVHAAGWGCTNKPGSSTCPYPTRLQALDMHVIADSNCGTKNFWNPPAALDVNICANGGKGDIRGGDSGGPLLVDDGAGGFVEVGVTSLGADKTSVLDGAFISIASERAWIDQAISELDPPAPTPDYCPNGDFSGSPYDGTCGTPPPTPDYCPGGDFSGSPYDGTCGTPPPPSQSINISWSGAHPSWIAMTVAGFGTGSKTYTCNFASGGNASYPFYVSASPQTWDNGQTCYDTIHGDRVWVTINGASSNVLTVP